MSYNSSHLRTNSISFSSLSEDNQAGHIASKQSTRSGDDVITAHMIRIEHAGLVTSRQTFSLGDGDGTELRREGDVAVSVTRRICKSPCDKLMNWGLETGSMEQSYCRREMGREIRGMQSKRLQSAWWAVTGCCTTLEQNMQIWWWNAFRGLTF